jgi:lysophospholipase L1-like esterase
MRRITTALSLVLLCATAGAQTKTWDSTYRPGNFAQRVEQFRDYPNSKKDIIFLGNSITAGVDWAELLRNPNARNRGISADITFGILDRLDEVTEGAPAKVFILIGINDISRNIPDSLIVRNYQQMITRIKKASPSTRIYFHTLLPVNNTFTQFKNHYNKDEHIQYVNEELKKMGQREKITVIDLHSHFVDSEGKLDKRYTQDGLHLTPAGYAVWARVLQQGKYL